MMMMITNMESNMLSLFCSVEHERWYYKVEKQGKKILLEEPVNISIVKQDGVKRVYPRDRAL
jgi:hypothetical protein